MGLERMPRGQDRGLNFWFSNCSHDWHWANTSIESRATAAWGTSHRKDPSEKTPGLSFVRSVEKDNTDRLA